MNLELDEHELRFRDEVRAFLRDNLTPLLAAGGRAATSIFCDPAFSLPWQRILNAKGWAVPHWPVQWGGTGWDAVKLYIFRDEMQQTPAPEPLQFGVNMVGPVIFTFGNEAQKKKYLPRIANLDDWWCQGFSEPGAGSDVQSIQCRAEREGDEYVVNGTKMWVTNGLRAGLVVLLCKTDPQADPPHKGMTVLMVEKEPDANKFEGITIPPNIEKMGYHGVETTEARSAVFLAGIDGGHAEFGSPTQDIKRQCLRLVPLERARRDFFAREGLRHFAHGNLGIGNGKTHWRLSLSGTAARRNKQRDDARRRSLRHHRVPAGGNAPSGLPPRKSSLHDTARSSRA